jgi:predicted metal-dependent hydrolase
MYKSSYNYFMQKEEFITLGENTYKVIITKKSVKNINFRFRNDVFYVSTPYLCSSQLALKHLNEIGPRLIKRTSKPNILFTDSSFYYMGNKYEGHDLTLNGVTYHLQNRKDFYNKIKKPFLAYISQRVEKYKEIMGVSSQMKIRVSYLSSRYGSNSIQTHTLHFSLILAHFREEIIDSVVIHELAHCFVFNHGDNFYSLVYRYCPNYDILDKELRKYSYVKED